MRYRVLATLCTVLIPSLASAADPPPMFAAYYVWYSTATGPRAHEHGWTADNHPSSAATPLAGFYDSDDPEIVRWHIRLAKASGISAFMISWWGPDQRKPNTFTQAGFETVLRIAEEENFHVALMDETAQFVHDFDTVKRWAADYLGKYKDSPAYLKIDNKPVYYVYQVSFNPRLTTTTFSELKEHVEKKLGPVYWIVDKISNANNHFHIPKDWLAAKGADSYACYGTFSNFRQWRYEDLIDRYREVVDQAHQGGFKMMLPIHPGHDNSRQHGRETDFFIIPRDDGATLRGYLRAARDSRADYILVTSFNEWPETTGVEPSSSFSDPYLYLKILSDFTAKPFVQPPEPDRIQHHP